MGMTSGNGERAQVRLNKINGNKSVKAKSGTLKQANIDGFMGQSLSGVQTRRVLEPRILLDAAAVETAFSMMDQVASEQAESYFDSSSENSQADQPVANTDYGLHPVNTENADDQIDVSNKQAVGASIVFIDAGVDDIETLTSSIDPSAEIVILSAESDGVEQIAAYLQDRSNIDSLHIISHGRSGTLDLGSAKLTAISMAGQYADEMAIIAGALSENADILLYGCDFAVGTRGANAISALAGVTGADIAASNDLTGSALLGGDWDLEVHEGTIEAQAIVAELYDALLPVDGQSVSGEAFARGNFVEMGLNANGTFGASAANRPSGFHDPRVSLFGFIANPQQDGWINYNGDFFTPGTPHEGFTLEVNGVSYTNDTASGAQITGSITSVTVGVLCGQQSVEVVWTGNIAGIEVTRTYTILENELFILSETTLRNTTGTAINNIYFAAQLDPDNDQTINGIYATTNTINNQPSGLNDVARVTASQAPGLGGSAEPDGSTISLVADDPRARAGYGGFQTADASDLYNGIGIVQATGSSTFHDESISMAFNVGTLGAGETTTLNYTYLLQGDPTAALACLNLPDAQPDGPTDIIHGTTVNIDVLANDMDPNGDPISITHVIDPANPGTQLPISVGSPVTLTTGTIVSLLVDGTLDVTGSPVNLGSETFDYIINDGITGEAQATVSLNITNTVPNAVDDGPIVLLEDNVASGSLFTNDNDPDGDIITLDLSPFNSASGSRLGHFSFEVCG